MSNITITNLLAISALGISFIGALVQIGRTILDARKSKVDMVESISKATASLLDPLNKRIDELEGRVMSLSKENEILRSDLNKNKQQVVELAGGVSILSDQIIRLGHTPKWKPKKKTP